MLTGVDLLAHNLPICLYNIIGGFILNVFRRPAAEFSFYLPDCLHGLLPAPFLLSYSVFDFDFFHYFSFLGRALD